LAAGQLADRTARDGVAGAEGHPQKPLFDPLV